MSKAFNRAAPAAVASAGHMEQPQELAPSAMDPQQLRNTLRDVAAAAEESLDEIKSIAGLALLAFESPGAYKSPELLAGAFRSILGRAQMLADVINSETERVGCHQVSPGVLRRHEAQRSVKVRP